MVGHGARTAAALAGKALGRVLGVFRRPRPEPLPQVHGVRLEPELDSLVADGKSRTTVILRFDNRKTAPRDGSRVRFRATAGSVDESAALRKGRASIEFTAPTKPAAAVVFASGDFGEVAARIGLKPTVLRWLWEWVVVFAIAGAVAFLVIRPFIVQSFFIPSGSMEPTLYKGDRLIANKFIHNIRKPRRGEVVIFRFRTDKAGPVYQVKDALNLGLFTIPLDRFDGRRRFNLGPLKLPLPGFFFAYVDYIKRVVAVEGDTVEVRAGVLYVNGEPAGEEVHRLGEPRRGRYMVSNACRIMDPSGATVARMELGQAPSELDGLAAFIRRQAPGLGEPAVRANAQKIHSIAYFGPFQVPEGHVFVLGDSRCNSEDSRTWGALPASNVVGKAVVRMYPFDFRRPVLIR